MSLVKLTLVSLVKLMLVRVASDCGFGLDSDSVVAVSGMWINSAQIFL